MFKITSIIFAALAIQGCATWTPEEQAAFTQALSRLAEPPPSYQAPQLPMRPVVNQYYQRAPSNQPCQYTGDFVLVCPQ
jgi:hypothetical protein